MWRLTARLALASWLTVGAGASALAQGGPAGDPAGSAPAIAGELTTLVALRDQLAQTRSEIATKTAQLPLAGSDAHAADINRAIVRLKQREKRLLLDVEVIATGLDHDALAADVDVPFDLTAELESLLRPIVEELKDATETPRHLERLRAELATLAARERKVDQAIERTGRLQAQNEDAALAPLLTEVMQKWQDEQRTLRTRRTVLSHRLERRLQAQSSFLDSTKDVLGGFFATRGMNILVALGAFLGTFIMLRVLYRLVRRLLRRHKQQRSFAARLVEVVFNLLTGLISLMAALIALYTTGDWVLLGLALLMLLGLAWAGKSVLITFFDQIRLLMNVGPVREGECVIHRGIPWEVEQLGLYTKLVNPMLAGGRMRLSTQEVLSLHSRPVAPSEAWFPCRAGD